MTTGRRPNILFLTLDQFRGDSLSCAGHPVVRTPNLDALAAEGVRFARHYSQAAPCAPGRAALYTGTYQMNNRVVANGSPLDSRLDTIAFMAQRAGYRPVVFGYTDQAADPRQIHDPNDPRWSNWEGVLPGFEEQLCLDERHEPWLAWLRELGYTGPASTDPDIALDTEHERPAEHSVTQFLTDHFLRWHAEQPADEPWFAHLSYIRPHPPYDAAGHYATMYDPADCPPALPIPRPVNPLHEVLLQVGWVQAPTTAAEVAHLRTQYYGMITEVDHHVGRLVQALRDAGQWENTLVVITSDHGEQLGDQGLVQKCGYFESSYHIVCIVRDPHGVQGRVVDRFTENIDITPTICDAMGLAVPQQCDGFPLTPFLHGEEPPTWRTAAHYEWDWRDAMIMLEPSREHAWPWKRSLERRNLAVLRTDTHAYVQFGDGDWLCFDLAADPTWQTMVTDPSVVLPLAQQMLVWRQVHLDRTLTGMLMRDGGIGRRPDPVAGVWFTA
ncbi:MAG TPA: sulfatase-like hydrolase/transferase [Ilumatobacteraceae bacterium]|nr:sulfatase-like hydrolase/transferase [Ilumatobacteraceae bacterium]